MTRTDKRSMDDAGLEAFFAAARDVAPAPSSELMARIVADAEATLVARAPAPLAVPRRRGRLRAVLAGLGGWPTLASMVTATLAGVWFGFASPDSLNTLSGGLLLPGSAAEASYDLEDMLPGYLSLGEIDMEVQG